MDLDRGKTNSLKGVKDSYRGVSVGGGINEDPVKADYGGLDPVYDRTLVVGLEKFHVYAKLRGAFGGKLVL